MVDDRRWDEDGTKLDFWIAKVIKKFAKTTQRDAKECWNN